MAKFIEDDIIYQPYEIKYCSTTFYVDIKDGKIEHIDEGSFKDNESRYVLLYKKNEKNK